MANEMKQQLSPARDASQNEPVERGAEDIPNSIQQKAAEALALLGFEALYQDVFEDGAASGYKSVSSNANSGASRTSGDLLIGNDTSVSTLAASSRGSVARFHQQRIDKYNDRTRKVEIRMVPDDLVGKRITPKRKGAFLTTDKSAHDSKRLMRPSKRGTMGMKMKEWLQSRRAGLTNSKGKVELKKKINANARSMEERPLVEKKRRLTIIFKKKRDQQVDMELDSLCTIGVLLQEVLDLGYFCHCLGEEVKEESLQWTGSGYTQRQE